MGPLYKWRVFMKQYKSMVEDLMEECETFLQQVNSIGNECAYTDRQLEVILDKATVIINTYAQDGGNKND